MSPKVPPELAQVRQEVEAARESWNDCWKAINDLEFSTTDKLAPIADGQHTLEDLNELLITILEYVAGAKFSKGFSTRLIPDQQLGQVRSNVETLETASKSLSQKLAQLSKSGGLQRFQEANLSAVAGNGQTHQLAELQNLYTSAQSLLRSFLAIYPALRSGTAVDLTKRATKLQEVVGEVNSAFSDAEEKQASVAKVLEAAEAAQSQIVDIQTKATERVAELEQSKADIDQLVADAKAVVATIRETGGSAAGLQEQVDDFEAKFEEFDKALEKRLAALAAANKKTEAAEGANQEREQEIDRLTAKADGMLRGATTAGFATSFASSHKAFKDEQEKATKGFWFAIALLVAAVLPLAFYVLDLPGAPDGTILGSKTLGRLSPSDPITLEGLLGRLVLLVPPVWLARFYSRRYARLFALREEYSHKQALAESIEGFRREAPEYEEEITAAVFWDLTRRGRRQVGHDDVPNPILKRLLNRLEGRFGGEGASE